MSTPSGNTYTDQQFLIEAARREMLLAMIRRGRVRLQFMITELDEIGVSLKYNMVSPEFAVVWINDVDAIGCVGVLPWMEEQFEVAA
jgi:hypothetical protein